MHATALSLRPLTSRPDRWSARRIEQYFALAHLCADTIARLVDEEAESASIASAFVDPAEEWFARTKVDDRTWHLYEQYVHPFLRCNVWLVRGRDRSMLVDTGLGLVSLTEAARDLLDQPLAAVATHHHFDHVGSLHEFADRYAHPAAAAYLASSAAIGGALHRSGFTPVEWQYFVDSGYILDDELLDALPAPGFDVDAYTVAPCPANHELDEGDVVDLGDIAYEVLHLPGHSPDSIGLFDRASGTLFSGRRGLRRPVARRVLRRRP